MKDNRENAMQPVFRSFGWIRFEENRKQRSGCGGDNYHKTALCYFGRTPAGALPHPSTCQTRSGRRVTGAWRTLFFLSSTQKSDVRFRRFFSNCRFAGCHDVAFRFSVNFPHVRKSSLGRWWWWWWCAWGGGCWNSSLLPFAEDGVASIHLFYMLPPTLMMGLLEPLPAVMVRRQGYILEKSSQGHLQRKNHSHWHTYEEFRVPNWPEMHVPVRGSWTTRTEATQTQGGHVNSTQKGPRIEPTTCLLSLNVFFQKM